MKLLVTGGAGFIGSHFCLQATGAGHEVVVLDNLSTGHREFAQWGDFVEGDLSHKDLLIDLLQTNKIEAVVHFAAKAQVAESVKNPELYHTNNIGGTECLLQAMEKCGVHRLIFSSSAAVYGQPSTELIPESAALKPMNPYGETKLQCEVNIGHQVQQKKLQAVILRYFNVIGQDDQGRVYEKHEPETHIVPNIVRALESEKPFSLYGDDYSTPDGTCIRDYVDVRDLALVHLEALKVLKTKDHLISNVGRGFGYSNLEIVRKVEEVFRKKLNFQIRPRREGDPSRLVADSGFFKTWYKQELRPLEQSIQSLL